MTSKKQFTGQNKKNKKNWIFLIFNFFLKDYVFVYIWSFDSFHLDLLW